jgi:hypothetical protein
MFSLTNHMNWNFYKVDATSFPYPFSMDVLYWFIFYLPQWNVSSMAAALSALWHSGASTV